MREGVRYGIWITLFIWVSLSALADRFWLGILGEIPTVAEELLLPLLFWGALKWIAWSAEEGLIALGRPGLRSGINWVGQLLRLALLVLLIPTWGLTGIGAAYILAELTRGLLGWYALHRHGLRVQLSFWQSFIAPAGAALIIYNLLHILAELLWTPEALPTLLFLMIVLLPILLLYAFLTALLGGWDDGGLEELQRAARLSGLGFPVAWLLYQAVHMGALVSPLHGIFSAELRDSAAEEAHSLTIRQNKLR